MDSNLPKKCIGEHDIQILTLSRFIYVSKRKEYLEVNKFIIKPPTNLVL